MVETILSKIHHRPLLGTVDAMRLRQFLIETYALFGREFNWETRRWEGQYWYATDAELARPVWDAHTQLWETFTGDIVGAAIADGPGDLAIQIHPDYRELENDIIAWAEKRIAVDDEEGSKVLTTWAFEWDDNRQDRLMLLGYIRQPEKFVQYRRRHVIDPVPDVNLAQGYTMRSLTPSSADVRAFVNCTNATYGHNHSREMLRNFQTKSPSHNYDLHIVAVAPDETFAAFAGLTVDQHNRTAIFEPVGTHPDHRRKGLAREVMYEGMRHIKAMGNIDTMYVANWGPSEEAANFYASVGMVHYATAFAWRKTF
ncbi:MAG: GNAT family N-acetyltransferase [Anaerolineaceae bacterium]|nr:GNAT family N-acetyltransferase [Anaerolineaceae bacterium]